MLHLSPTAEEHTCIARACAKKVCGAVCGCLLPYIREGALPQLIKPSPSGVLKREKGHSQRALRPRLDRAGEPTVRSIRPFGRRFQEGLQPAERAYTTAGLLDEKRHGHDVKPDALPPPGDGPTEHVFRPKKNASTPEKGGFPQGTSQDLPEIDIPKRLTRPVPLVRAVRERMTESTDQFGRLRIRGFKASPVCVSPSSAGQALRLLQAIVKAAGELGWTASIGRTRTETTYLEVEGTDVPFRLFEKSRQVERSKPKNTATSRIGQLPAGLGVRADRHAAHRVDAGLQLSRPEEMVDPARKTGIEEIKSFLKEVQKFVAFKKEERRRRKEKKHRREAEKRRKEEPERRRKRKKPGDPPLSVRQTATGRPAGSAGISKKSSGAPSRRTFPPNAGKPAESGSVVPGSMPMIPSLQDCPSQSSPEKPFLPGLRLQ